MMESQNNNNNQLFDVSGITDPALNNSNITSSKNKDGILKNTWNTIKAIPSAVADTPAGVKELLTSERTNKIKEQAKILRERLNLDENPYIEIETPEETNIPKPYKEIAKPKDIYTKDELEYKRANMKRYRSMTDEEWNDYINRDVEYYMSLNKTLSKKINKLQKGVPQDIIEEIKQQPPMGLVEYMQIMSSIRKHEKTLEGALLKIKDGKNLTEEEYMSLLNRQIARLNITLRGVETRGEVFDGVVESLKANADGIASMLITDTAIAGGLAGLNYISGGLSTPLTATKYGAMALKWGKKINDINKTYKTVRYSSKALKIAGMTYVSSKSDNWIKTNILEPSHLSLSKTREETIREKKINKTLAFSDKGEMILNQLSKEEAQKQEDFIKYQTDTERSNDAWGERIVDRMTGELLSPIAKGIFKSLNVPDKVLNNVAIRTLRKINDIPAINKTATTGKVLGRTFHSLGEEHLEELFSLSMNHLMNANDPDTSYHQALTEYVDPHNFTVSTLNILIAGGIVKQVSNVLTRNPNGKETESINRNILKKHYKKLFDNNPDLILNKSDNKLSVIHKDNYEAIIDKLPENKIEKLTEFVLQKEDKQSREKYYNKLDTIKQNLINTGINEKEADNIIKIYDTVYTQSALNYGVSRYDIANRIELEFRMREENESINAENYNQAMYKSPETNIKDFVNKTNDKINNGENIEKQSYFVLNEKNNIILNTDTIQHTKKHNLIVEDWEDIQNSLNNNNIINYGFNIRNNRLSNNNIILELKGNKNNYGVVIGLNNKNNNIITAFKKENINLWNEWFNKSEWSASGSSHTSLLQNDRPSITIHNLIIQAKDYFVKQDSKNNNQSYNQAINTDLELNQEVNILDVSNTIKGKITKESIKNKIQELIDKKEPIETLSEPWMMELLNSKKGHIINGSQYGKLKPKNYNERNRQLLNIDDLIRNSILIEKVGNTKKDKKPNIDNYYYFYTPIKDKNNIYIIKLVAENSKKDNIVNLYDVIVEKELLINDKGTKSNLGSSQAGMEINNSSSLTIKQILSNVKDIDGNNALESYLKENTDSYKQNNQQEIKGRSIFKEGKAVIELFRNKADQSTLLHESAHYFLKLIETYSKDNDNIIAQNQLQEIKEWTASELTKNPSLYMHERFARGFEQYIRSGKANNNYLKEVFDYFKGFLERIYKSADELDIDVNNKKMFEFFDKYLYHPENYNNWVYGDGNDEDKIKQEQDNNILKTNDLTTLILNQATETDEDLKKTIDEKIKKITDKIENENDDYNYYSRPLTEEEEKYYKNQAKTIEKTSEEISFLIEALNDTEDTKTQSKLLRSELGESQYKAIRSNKEIDKQQSNLERLSLVEKYMNIREEQQEQRRETITEEEIKDYYNNYTRNKEEELFKNIFNMLDKLWDKNIKEEKEYRDSVLKRVNDGRKNVISEAERLNISTDIKLYRNVEEMLRDFEKSAESKTHRQKEYEDKKLNEANEYGDSYNDYNITYDEYRNIVNFKQRSLKKDMYELKSILEDKYKLLKQAEKRSKEETERRFDAQKEIENLKQQIIEQEQEKNRFKEAVGINPDNLETIMKKSNILKEPRTMNKILGLAKKHNNIDYITNKIDTYSKIESKQDIQNAINNLLLNTVNFSKSKGKLYGNTLYKDTGIVQKLKEYNKYSMKKAGEELINITKQREEGLLKDNEVEYQLKRNLLFFRSTPAVELTEENKIEILNALGNFLTDSQRKQNELKTEKLFETLALERETIDLIKDNKINKGWLGLGADVIAFGGNLPTILEYTGGRELANKFDFIPIETAYRVGIKEKTDNLFKNIFDIFGSEKTPQSQQGDKSTPPPLRGTSPQSREGLVGGGEVKTSTYSQGGEGLVEAEISTQERKELREEKNWKELAQENNLSPIDLTEEFSFIKSTDRDEIAKEVENYLNDLINKEIKTNNEKLKIKILDKHKGHIIHSNINLNERNTEKHNLALLNLEEIINNSIKTGEANVDLNHNAKRTANRKAKEVENYRYFKTQIKINNNIYDVNLVTEVIKNSDNKDISNLYNVAVKKSDPASPLSNNRWESFTGSQSYSSTSNIKSQETYKQETKGQNKNKEETQKNIEEILKDYNKPLMELAVVKRDDEGNATYRKVKLNERLDSITEKLRAELEANIEKDKYKEEELKNILTDIEYLKSLNKLALKGGGIRNYNYRLSEYDFMRLEEIMTKSSLGNLLKDNIQKPYSEIAPYKINKWGLMYYYLQKKNKETNKLIEKYYDKQQINKLNKLLEEQDNKFFKIAESLFDAVQDRNELNVYYVMEFNKDMGKIENYFPRVSFHEDDSNIFDMLTSNQTRDQKITAIETRSKDAIPNLNNNPLLLALKHIRQTEFTKTVAVELNKTQQIFNAPNVKQNIIDKKGQDIYNAIKQHLDKLKYSYGEADSNIDKLLNYMMSNWAKSVTNTPSVFLKQMTSFGAYMEDVNSIKFLGNYVKGLLHPIETMKYMMDKSPYINVRLNGNEYKNILDIAGLKVEEENTILNKMKSFNNLLSNTIQKITPTRLLKRLTGHTLTELGDIVSVIYGGYARLQTQIQNGMNVEEAIRDFEKQTVETQQSDYSSLKSRKNLKDGLFNRLAGMFRSQDTQYLQKEMRNIIRLINKEEGGKSIRNRLLLYHFTLPLMMTFIQGVIDAVYGRKDKEWWEYTAELTTAMIYSFLPLSLVGQQVALDLTFNPKDAVKVLMNIQGAITGLPVQAYKKIFFNRYYDSVFDLYDTEETKKKKVKREKEKEK